MRDVWHCIACLPAFANRALSLPGASVYSDYPASTCPHPPAPPTQKAANNHCYKSQNHIVLYLTLYKFACPFCTPTPTACAAGRFSFTASGHHSAISLSFSEPVRALSHSVIFSLSRASGCLPNFRTASVTVSIRTESTVSSSACEMETDLTEG